MMKKTILIALFALVAIEGFSIGDRVRLGLAVAPGIAWSKPVGKILQQGQPRFGVSYGFVFEYWFAKNYGIVSGLGGAYDGCNIKGRSEFQNVSGVFVRTVNERYGFHYLEIPAYLKLKTNNINGSNFCVWGKVGFTINLTVSARANYSDSITTLSGENILIEKENILRKDNEVTRTLPNFRSNVIDLRVGGGLGFEYQIDDRTSFLAGLQYHNGFINNLFDRDAKKEPNVMRFMSLVVGVLF